ncbi:MAG: agmatine deiminase family protein [Bacteroidales bacterium]|nr:agmatine deiminase family protein [Bacteroidales bacterium]
MKKGLLLFVALATSAVTLFAQPIYNENTIRYQHSPIEEGMAWTQSQETVPSPTAPAPPPSGQIRPVAEWEPAEAVLIRYPLGIPYSLIKEMAEDVLVITVVSSSNLSAAQTQYQNNNVNMANCEFLIANTNTYWTRDYGPWFMAIDDNEVAMFDFDYNRPRPLDNQVNTALANYLSVDRYASTLQLTGGNYMNDGIKQAASTTLTLTENSGMTQQQIKDQFQQYLGIEEYHFIADPIVPYDNIQHIDCWSKLLAPDKVLVARVPTNNPNYNKFETAANYFASLTSSLGTPMQVFRVDAPGATSSSPKTPYTNSLILNNKVFVPIGGNSYDADALQVYQQAMPGYTIIPITQLSSEPWVNTDALHCRTHEIADRCMLYIKHQPLFGEIENTGSVTFNAEVYSYCDKPIYSDSVLIYLKHSGGAYQKYNMTYSGDNQWNVTVTGLPSGLIEYYVFAADESGRRSCHPYIGAPDPHKFTLIGAAPDVPILVLDKTSSSVTSEGFAIIEDYITVSNAGTADLTFEITNIDFHEMLTIAPLNGTVQPGGSQIITLSYNFAGIENGEYTGSFDLLSNDPLKPVTEISLSAIQNVTDLIPVLSLDKTSSEVTSEGTEIIEDFITVSSVGTADLTFEITEIEFHEMLTVAPLNGTLPPGASQILTLSYDFSNVEQGEYSGSFKLLSNDPEQPVTEIVLYAYQTITGIVDPKMSVLYIYPNPAQNVIHVYYNDDSPIKAHIYNVLGQQLKETTLTKEVNTIDIQELPGGVYFLKIGGNAFKFIKR